MKEKFPFNIRFRFKSLKSKILFGFSIIMVLVLILSSYNFVAVDNSNQEVKKILNEDLPLLTVSEKMAYNIAERTLSLRSFLLYNDSSSRQDYNELMEINKELEKEMLSLTDSEKAQEFINKKKEWDQKIADVFTAYDNGNEEEAMHIMNLQVSPRARQIMRNFEEMGANQEAVIEKSGTSVIATGQTVWIAGGVMAIVIIIVGIIVALLTSRSISKPITKVMDRMKAIAARDLSHDHLDIQSHDEIGQLVKATNQMNENTRELLQKIHSVTETVSNQSDKLTKSADEVQQGSEQIAATMEEIASSSESQANHVQTLSSNATSFTSNVQEANARGEQMEQTSSYVLQMTEAGTNLMEESIHQMKNVDTIVKSSVEKVQELDHQSQKITQLVTVIRDIADQTNLLALNAAIEAARAGEHGKGFAVVADEVRKLAEQVANSVTDITEITGTIQSETSGVVNSLESGYSEVEKGTRQIKYTGETFSQINQAMEEMADSIDTVAHHLSNMASTSQQMTSSIEEMATSSEETASDAEEASASAQQTNSSMEEVSSSSDELSKLSDELRSLVERFKL
ncbi:methyl-accepting chemotaxis protein [Virgibacillus sp. MSP4-1]|uniref:methyl-accepting chemotaxis protein n=1 Tax=Virgibacillus sp. MSP4-1 TaxID=2700081 RepID=UPI0003A73EB2|nr:methyl-accepting chemotaxis protein [Virgibacillus sp. MSP4-1]